MINAVSPNFNSDLEITWKPTAKGSAKAATGSDNFSETLTSLLIEVLTAPSSLPLYYALFDPSLSGIVLVAYYFEELFVAPVFPYHL
jgi:hypothetical protein